jgi:hypothetical protein
LGCGEDKYKDMTPKTIRGKAREEKRREEKRRE